MSLSLSLVTLPSPLPFFLSVIIFSSLNNSLWISETLAFSSKLLSNVLIVLTLTKLPSASSVWDNKLPLSSALLILSSTAFCLDSLIRLSNSCLAYSSFLFFSLINSFNSSSKYSTLPVLYASGWNGIHIPTGPTKTSWFGSISRSILHLNSASCWLGNAPRILIPRTLVWKLFILLKLFSNFSSFLSIKFL